jgi:hypothetical protein
MRVRTAAPDGVRAVAGRADELHIMDGLSGEWRLSDFELPWLPRGERPSPVRICNALLHFGVINTAQNLAQRDKPAVVRQQA